MKWSIRLTGLSVFLTGIVLLVFPQAQRLKMAQGVRGGGPQSRIDRIESGTGTGQGKAPAGRIGHGPETAQVSAATDASMMRMPLVAPLFIEDRDFSSTLAMVNASSLNTFADVVLTGMDGVEIPRKRVQFTPHSQRRIRVGATAPDL
jgi:hypothetical protein